LGHLTRKNCPQNDL